MKFVQILSFIWQALGTTKVILTVMKQQLQRNAQKKIGVFNVIWTHYLCNTGVMFYQLSYEALLEAGQERVQ